MARHRRDREARHPSKLAERPIADVILGPCARLPLAPDMAAEIAMRWNVLGPVGHQRFAAGDLRADDVDAADEPDERGEHARWLADTRRLVDRVREHSRGADFRARLLSDMGKADDANNFADRYAADLAALVRRDPHYLDVEASFAEEEAGQLVDAAVDTVTDEHVRWYQESMPDSPTTRDVIIAATSGLPVLRWLGRRRIAATINARAKAVK